MKTLLSLTIIKSPIIDLNNINWELLYSIAVNNGLCNLLMYKLKTNNKLEILPKEIKNKILHLIIWSKYHLDKYDKEIEKIAEISKNHGLRPIFLKGIALNNTVYRQYKGSRVFADLDILLSEQEADILFKILINELNYKCNSNDEKQKLYKLISKHYAPLFKDNLCIEIHPKLTQSFVSYTVNISRIIENAMQINLNGYKIFIPSMEDLLIHLCVHLYNHHALENKYRLRFHSDIINLLVEYKEKIDWDKIIKYVIDDNLKLPVTYGLYYTNLLYKDIINGEIIPEEIIKRIKTKNFKVEIEAVKSKDLLNDKKFGQWNIPYMERFLIKDKEIIDYVNNCYMEFSVCKKWKKVCKDNNIKFNKEYVF